MNMMKRYAPVNFFPIIIYGKPSGSAHAMGTSFKGNNLLPEGANSFIYERFLIVWKITFTTFGDLP